MSADDTKKWWAEYAGDASVTAARTHIFDAVAAHLREIADRPIAWHRNERPAAIGTARYRSIVMRVAQYWNDQADDECHLDIFGSGSDDPPAFTHAATTRRPSATTRAALAAARAGSAMNTTS